MDKDGNELYLTTGNVKSIGHKHNERITEDAVRRVAMREESRMDKIFRLAKVMARHAGRKTIKEEDIEKVYQFEDEI